MKRAHYHVLAGVPGYMPDNNAMFLTKKDASNDAEWEKDCWLDAWPGAKASGNKREGYTIDRSGGDPSSYTLPVYIDIVRCEDASCDIDAEDF